VIVVVLYLVKSFLGLCWGDLPLRRQPSQRDTETEKKEQKKKKKKKGKKKKNEKEKVVQDGAGADGKADCRVQGGFQSLRQGRRW
jgi:hypothetical protein